METPKPRPYAALIKAWADGYTIQTLTWEGYWKDMDDPVWDEHIKYRVKPKTPKTPKAEPKLKMAERYYAVSDSAYVKECVWTNGGYDNLLFDVGNCFKTYEEAEAAAERVRAALKGEESEEVKQDQWKPVLGETYFYLNDELSPSEEEWEDSNFDQYMFEHHNCFKTHEECKAAAARVKAALKGKESEELKKLRKENEELNKLVMSPYLNGKPVSDGELALIRAIRKAGVSYVWQHGCALLIDKEDFVAHGDFIAFLTSGEATTDDKVRDALNAISREQEQEANND